MAIVLFLGIFLLSGIGAAMSLRSAIRAISERAWGRVAGHLLGLCICTMVILYLIVGLIGSLGYR